MMAGWWWGVLTVFLSSPTGGSSNKFGIGVYTDTAGSPAIADQLDAAAHLVGNQGWATVYLCAWRDDAARRPTRAATRRAAARARRRKKSARASI